MFLCSLHHITSKCGVLSHLDSVKIVLKLWVHMQDILCSIINYSVFGANVPVQALGL